MTSAVIASFKKTTLNGTSNLVNSDVFGKIPPLFDKSLKFCSDKRVLT